MSTTIDLLQRSNDALRNRVRELYEQNESMRVVLQQQLAMRVRDHEYISGLHNQLDALAVAVTAQENAGVVARQIHHDVACWRVMNNKQC